MPRCRLEERTAGGAAVAPFSVAIRAWGRSRGPPCAGGSPICEAFTPAAAAVLPARAPRLSGACADVLPVSLCRLHVTTVAIPGATGPISVPSCLLLLLCSLHAPAGSQAHARAPRQSQRSCLYPGT